MTARSQSSRRWLDRHFKDPYVKKAQEDGYRSRAAYKLLEIQKQHPFIKPSMTVVDLGAAPGGWTQVVSHYLKNSGKIIALDILEISSLASPNIIFLQGDFESQEIISALNTALDHQKADIILSDMAPNTSGIRNLDQIRSVALAESAVEFAKQTLKLNGSFLVKIFQGEGFDDYLKTLRKLFKTVLICKPKASRAESKEIYLLGLLFRGNKN